MRLNPFNNRAELLLFALNFPYKSRASRGGYQLFKDRKSWAVNCSYSYNAAHSLDIATPQQQHKKKITPAPNDNFGGGQKNLPTLGLAAGPIRHPDKKMPPLTGWHKSRERLSVFIRPNRLFSPHHCVVILVQGRT